MLDQVGLGFDLTRFQVGDHFPRQADFLGDYHSGQVGRKVSMAKLFQNGERPSNFDDGRPVHAWRSDRCPAGWRAPD